MLTQTLFSPVFESLSQEAVVVQRRALTAHAAAAVLLRLMPLPSGTKVTASPILEVPLNSHRSPQEQTVVSRAKLQVAGGRKGDLLLRFSPGELRISSPFP
ncbi:hypothetical protein CB1_000350010 [Camelus ferus]|nr:hypothetical protein CB1_000350010 [Camelus ferus]